MKKRKFTAILLIAITVIIGALALKLTVPLSYADRPVYQESADFVAGFQKNSALTAEQAAMKYFFYHTDYESEVPTRIKVSSTSLGAEQIRVTIFDPSCHDDSISSSIDRVYMRRNAMNEWIPIKVDSCHKGRGRFGWTTSPTL